MQAKGQPLWLYVPQRNWETPPVKGFCIFNHPLRPGYFSDALKARVINHFHVLRDTQWLCLGSVPTCRGKKMLGEFSSAPTPKTASLNYDFTADHTNYVQWSTDGQNFFCLPEHQVQLSRRARPFLTGLACSPSPWFSEAKPQHRSRGIQDLFCPTITLQSSFQQEAKELKMDF